MFGRAKRERAEMRDALAALKERLDAMQKELCELRDATRKELCELGGRVDAKPHREEETDDMNTLVNKWINGEKGDGR